MQASQTPTLVPLAFAANGTKNTIPEASQIGITPGAASLNDGFPPLTFTPIAAGGVPPAGADFNGILNLISAVIRWQNAGGQFKWNSAFATDTNVGGYPAGAVLERSDGAGFWLNLADNNATNPDATDGSAANWAPLEGYGITAVTGLTNANVTLTPPQFGLPIITLSGTLTGNVQIIFPALKSQWLLINNTTGAFTVTAKTAAGSGVAVPQGVSAQLYGDGTNILQAMSSTGRLLSIQTFNSSGTYTPTAGTTHCRVTVVGGGGSGGGAAATLSGQWAAGGGGGGGANAIGYYPVASLSGQAITIGAGGAPASGNGNNGGTSSIGAVVTAGGGIGGAAGFAASTPVVAAGGSGGASIVGANVSGGLGGPGCAGIANNTGNLFSGNGGGSFLSQGSVGILTANSAGNSGSGPGCGASGATSSNGGIARASGQAAPGIVIIEEFA